MKLIKTLTCFILILFSLLQAAAQQKSPQQIATEKAFISILNDAARRFPMNDFGTSDSTATLIQPFAINNKGEISAAWHVPTDSGFYLIKKKVRICAIKKVFYDDYIGFQTVGNKITLSTSKTNSKTYSDERLYFLFHLARVAGDSEDLHSKLQKALDKLRPYYPIDK